MCLTARKLKMHATDPSIEEVQGRACIACPRTFVVHLTQAHA
jgi:hypothetical protein